MAVIKLTSLGGLMPSIQPRALPDGAAQKAHNVMARTTEFRPLQADVQVAVSAVGSPKTLHRLARDANGAFTSDMSLGWKSNAAEINYVKGQVADEATERTYYTYADGSAPPRVLDATGFDKPLGVPTPTTAPQGLTNVVYSYSPEARAAELAVARDKAVDAIRKSVQLSWLGAKFGGLSHPGNTTPGYMDLTYTYGIDSLYNPDYAKTFRVFAVSGPNSAVVTNSYTNSVLTAQANPGPVNELTGVPDHLGVFDPRLGGVYAQAAGPYGSTTWAAYGQNVFVVPFYVYGRTFDFDLNTVKALFAQIKMPGTNNAVQLFSDVQATDFLNNLKAVAGVTSARIKPLLDALDSAANAFHTILDSGNLSSIDFVVQKQAEFKVLSDAIGAEYDKIDSELAGMLEQFFYSYGIDAWVPQGIARIIEDRFYVYTYVTAWGEESAPSPVSQMAEVDQNDTVTGSPANPPAGYGITKFRYYRTNVGNNAAAFQFVDEVTFSASSLAGGALTTVTDNKKSSELGEVCPTLTWAPPPYRSDSASTAQPRATKGANPYLRGLVAMPNGVLAGFFDNTVCFSESFIPYAWPVEYQLTTDFPIVGLGVFGQALVVLTQGIPCYVSGSDAASMSMVKLESQQACVSNQSIAAAEGGVVYASPDGLCLASQTGVQLITNGHFTREDWQKLVPSSIVAEVHENTYYFLYNNGATGCYALHLETGKLTTLDVQGSALYNDLLTDRLYIATGNDIVALFAGVTHRAATWRTKIAVMPKHTAFAWLVIESDFEAPITVRWYGDGNLVYTTTVTDREPQRLPDGEYLEHEIEIESSARWNALTFASSTAELKQA